MRRLDPQETTILVVDVQEKLAAAMPPAAVADVTRAATVLLEAAATFGVRVIATEQYPQGLGRTLAPIADLLRTHRSPVIEKVEFSACDNRDFERAWASTRSKTAIVLGMEAHVCVFQTVRELTARGISVIVPIDGVASRRDDHRVAGLELCRSAGALLSTMESIVFDWLQRAGTPEFKKISKLVR
ncbi:MAG: isochorismatase family protein [Byssovorax sp.]